MPTTSKKAAAATTPAKKAAAPTRHQRTPRERAQEALDIEQRKVVSLGERLARVKAELEPLETELAAAVRRRDYLASSPDLVQDETPGDPSLASQVIAELEDS